MKRIGLAVALLLFTTSTVSLAQAKPKGAHCSLECLNACASPKFDVYRIPIVLTLLGASTNVNATKNSPSLQLQLYSKTSIGLPMTSNQLEIKCSILRTSGSPTSAKRTKWRKCNINCWSCMNSMIPSKNLVNSLWLFQALVRCNVSLRVSSLNSTLRRWSCAWLKSASASSKWTLKPPFKATTKDKKEERHLLKKKWMKNLVLLLVLNSVTLSVSSWMSSITNTAWRAVAAWWAAKWIWLRLKNLVTCKQCHSGWWLW